MDDLRDWLAEMNKRGELKLIEGVNWNHEMGYISVINAKRRPNRALLFDNIVGYPSGYKVLTCSLSTRSRLAYTLNLADTASDLEMVPVLSQKLGEWEMNANKFPPEVVSTGAVLENIHSGNDIDLLEFPVPKWHELDGGRFIGTGHVVITRDPDTGEVNLGTYRVMVHDKKTAGIFMSSPIKHGRMHREKWHAMGKPWPIALSIGHHPLFLALGANPFEKNEYGIGGAIVGEPIKVINEEVTGLPIPADSEIVLAGWCHPGKLREEGPFGEATGYYAGGIRKEPVIEVERIYHRNNPIILGSPPARPPSEHFYPQQLVWNAMLHNSLMNSGIPDIKGVWVAEGAGGAKFVIISIKQRYMGHVKRVAFAATQSRAMSFWARYIIIVDEDIDPSNMNDVIWALVMRSQPNKDIDIINDWSSIALDPLIPKPADVYSTSIAIINACVPYDQIDKFPPTIKFSPDLVNSVRKKFKDLF